jgi:hypothetical protein
MTPYRILVTGSRRATLEDIAAVHAALTEAAAEPLRNGRPVVVVQGESAAGGVSLAAKVWAAGTPGVESEGHWAKWDIYGADAESVRDAVMVARGADVCLAFHRFVHPESGPDDPGDCLAKAKAAGIPVKAHPLPAADTAGSVQRCGKCGHVLSVVSA